MRSLLGSLGVALLLLLGLPAAGSAAADGALAPTCAEGPETVGATTYGTPCADLIVVQPGVTAVQAGAGDDTIVPAPITAESPPCPGACFLGIGSQTYDGGPGDDIVFGQRGNDNLRGGEGNDQLFGGIGDDVLSGGPGNDRLAGGHGADAIDGEEGDDYVHGDGTIDRIRDTGGGSDTLSYASGITPGFGGAAVENAGYANLLPPEADRGVFLDLSAAAESLNGNNGVAALGGGVDRVEGPAFETIVGTAFSDHVEGTVSGQTFYGGGGADVARGGGNFVGGAAGDSNDGGIGLPAADEVSVGAMMPPGGPYTQLYLTGSAGPDAVTATYFGSSVLFTLSAGSFDQDAAAEAGCGAPSPTEAICLLPAPLDSIVLAGLDGNDTIVASSFPATVTVMLLGGDGADSLAGGSESEDVLIDGPDAGADVLNAFGSDDALMHNGGADQIFGGEGNDLFLSDSVCDGNLINGGPGRDNASWARFKEGVGANLGSGRAGRPGSGPDPVCSGGPTDSMAEIEDLEGSESADSFYGDAGPNQLLGHPGPDVYHAEGGADSILANSGDADSAIDCGADIDRALVDLAAYGDPAPVNCEAVREAEPNSFQILPAFPTPPPLPPPAPVVAPKPKAKPKAAAGGDRTPPRTTILARPRAVLFTERARRRVVLRFASSERGSTFRCQLDRLPFQGCKSPRAYSLVLGKHRIRIRAVDASGNADPSPAVIKVRVRPR